MAKPRRQQTCTPSCSENLGEERDKPARVDLDHGAGAPGAA